jgi:hypothetical protein
MDFPRRQWTLPIGIAQFGELLVLASRQGFIVSSQWTRRGSQVVRHGSAKAAFVGSIPTLASKYLSFNNFRLNFMDGYSLLFQKALVENRPSPQGSGCEGHRARLMKIGAAPRPMVASGGELGVNDSSIAKSWAVMCQNTRTRSALVQYSAWQRPETVQERAVSATLAPCRSQRTLCFALVAIGTGA